VNRDIGNKIRIAKTMNAPTQRRINVPIDNI
jgi:hypothetical protein